MSIEMRYFVLKPRSKSSTDQYAEASRGAMEAYANEIYGEDPILASELRAWVSRERERTINMILSPNKRGAK